MLLMGCLRVTYQDEVGCSEISVQRWQSVDPLAEKMPWNSPYVYCSDNPVNKIDPDGRVEWPVNKTYQGYSRRHENNWGYPRPHGRTHKGVDINHTGGGNTDRGAPIIATHNGTITRIGHTGDGDGGGNRIQITSADGTVATNYMHLDGFASGLKVGMEINEGQQIGTMGGSGKNGQSDYTSHLHYEIIVDGVKVNPATGSNGLIDPQKLITSTNGGQQSETPLNGGSLQEVVIQGQGSATIPAPTPQLPVPEVKASDIKPLQ